MSLQLAAASCIYIYYALKKRRKESEWWKRQLYTSRDMYSGSSLLADVSFQSVSGLFKNFARMSPSEFKFFINLVAEKISKKDTELDTSPLHSSRLLIFSGVKNVDLSEIFTRDSAFIM